MLRSVLVVLAGLVVGMFVITAVESLIPMVYPLPLGLDPKDPEALAAAFAAMPSGVFLMLMAAWAFGSLTGGVLTARLAAHSPMQHALAVGVIQTVGAVANFVMLPHPAWVIAAGIAVFVPMALLGGSLGRRPAQA